MLQERHHCQLGTVPVRIQGKLHHEFAAICGHRIFQQQRTSRLAMMINPIAAIATAHMMLTCLGELQAAENIESAMQKTIKKMKSMLVGKMGYSTGEIGNMVVGNL